MSAPAQTVHSGFTRDIIALAGSRGADVEALWQACGLDPERLGDEVIEAAHMRAWAAIMAALRDPGFPIRVAENRSIDDYALLGLACKTARCVGDAIEHLIRYLSIWNRRYRLEVIDRGDRAELALRGPTGDLARRCTNESAVAQLLNAIRDVCGQRVRPLQVWFRHRRPADTAAHESFFGCPVGFSGDFDGLVLSRATLETELRLADSALSRFLLGQLDDLLARRADRESLPAKVQREIGQRLPGGMPRLADVAAALGMSARSLQRELAAEHESFARLADATRRELAVELLGHSQLAVAEIAFALGFSEPSAFHRAFKRWTGETPSAFRPG